MVELVLKLVNLHKGFFVCEAGICAFACSCYHTQIGPVLSEIHHVILHMLESSAFKAAATTIIHKCCAPGSCRISRALVDLSAAVDNLLLAQPDLPRCIDARCQQRDLLGLEHVSRCIVDIKLRLDCAGGREGPASTAIPLVPDVTHSVLCTGSIGDGSPVDASGGRGACALGLWLLLPSMLHRWPCDQHAFLLLGAHEGEHVVCQLVGDARPAIRLSNQPVGRFKSGPLCIELVPVIDGVVRPGEESQILLS